MANYFTGQEPVGKCGGACVHDKIGHTGAMPPDIVFECTKCRQWLEAPPDMVGLFVECPKCGEIIKVPHESTTLTPAPVTAPPVPSPDTKGTTMRIDLPPNLGIPQPPRRRFVIRRKGGS